MKQLYLTAAMLITFLSGCQSTSLREYSAEQSNTAKSLTEQQADLNYPTPAESHLRMYIFTSEERMASGQESREGYYVDFAIEENKIN